jgi:hypothetical protein
MPQSRTRYQRAAKRSRYRKPKHKRGGSFGWNVAIATVLIVGVVAVFLVRGGGDASSSGPPRAPDQAANVAGDHWHTAFQVDVCGQWLAAQPQFEKPADNPNQTANVGIHTHGDNLIHTHPFVVSEEGGNARLRKFADYGGWSVSSDSIDAWTGPKSAPSRTEWSNGDTCPFGQFKGEKGTIRWAVDGKERTGNPADYKMVDGETLAIYFVPKGADLPFPPDACTAFAQITDAEQALLSKTSPCRAQLPTTTTAPAGETTTAPAGEPTTSTP